MKFKEIRLPFRIKKPILALGADVKNTITIGFRDRAFISEIIGDLAQYSNFRKFDNSLNSLPKRFKVAPQIIAHDLHPEYFSTKFALGLSAKNYKFSSIQHHHAHIASCMAENGLDNQKIIGVAFDGTGFGNDNTLWGAEFLICDYTDYQRKAQLKYIPLVGGDMAIWQPWRVAALWLYLIYKDRFLNLKIDFLRRIDKKKWLVLKRMYRQGFNSPLSSSMGRLFDSIASLVLSKVNVKFEAEAAIDLEKKASKFLHTAKLKKIDKIGAYSFRIRLTGNKYIIDPCLIIKEIVTEIKKKKAKEEISYRFHYTIAQTIRKTCSLLRRKTKINRVALSGGVFQNKVLLQLSLDLLYKEGFKVFVHKKLSCNDSIISLGQLAIANFSRSAIRLRTGSRRG